MSTIYTHRSSNVRKTWLIMSAFFVFIILVGWVYAQAMQTPSVVYIAVAFALIMNIASYWYSDKLVLMMTHAKEVQKRDAPELYRIVENLAITAGLPTPKVYIINEPAPNAFATGRDEKHAVVAVTAGLLERLDKVELEAVLAHELSHIGNKDMLVSTIAVVLVGFVALLSDFFLRWTIFGGRGRSNERGDGRIQMLFLVIGIALAILAPIIATLLRLAVSRSREFLADASAVMLTRHPEALATALEKISSDPRQLRTANHATAHLFIANPFRNGGKKGFLTKLFMTHPPVEERTRALREMNV
ncbi:MAG: M48 family metallopeptidase [Candidatus Azambacteria bacterium]|nr:M48 family metallopeptidase [Candidatus Azambacteria bacterium]